MKKIILLFSLVFFLSGCNDNNIYGNYTWDGRPGEVYSISKDELRFGHETFKVISWDEDDGMFIANTESNVYGNKKYKFKKTDTGVEIIGFNMLLNKK